jgi:hypothetical protein
MNKKQLGQFYTTHNEYILQGLTIPDDIDTIIEPFVGSGELIRYLKKHYPNISYEMYDVDTKYEDENVITRDTLLNPPSYEGKFVLTNPPYLARNKNTDKTLYEKYHVNDLYKCFMKSLIITPSKGGIVIIPLNFWCSVRTIDTHLRRDFLNVYKVIKVNVFEERVFEDTSYTICSFLFVQKQSTNTSETIPFCFFPSRELQYITIEEPLWIIGQDIYDIDFDNKYKVSRWVENDNIDCPNTKLTLMALDDGRTDGNRIRLSMTSTPYRGKASDRTKASLIILPEISEGLQEKVVVQFNRFIETNRKKYHSMFLSNYRESIDYARKRISFDLAYNIIKYILCVLSKE